MEYDFDPDKIYSRGELDALRLAKKLGQLAGRKRIRLRELTEELERLKKEATDVNTINGS